MGFIANGTTTLLASNSVEVRRQSVIIRRSTTDPIFSCTSVVGIMVGRGLAPRFYQ